VGIVLETNTVGSQLFLTSRGSYHTKAKENNNFNDFTHDFWAAYIMRIQPTNQLPKVKDSLATPARQTHLRRGGVGWGGK
jgi:hypothetical protein